VAQYGGHGGGGNIPWSPGGSPIGMGGGAGGVGINSHFTDEGLDAIMSRTHKDAPIDEKRNMEKRLEHMHLFSEDDSIPYHLSPEERNKLRLKKNIWRREHLIEETQKSIEENTPAFIREHYHPKPHEMRTIEQSLSARHLEPKNRQYDPREDEASPQDRPTRIHTVAQIVEKLAGIEAEQFLKQADLMHGTGRMQGENEDDTDTMSSDYARYHTYPMGNTPMLTTGEEVENDLGNLYKSDWGGGQGPNTETLMDYPNPDQIGSHTGPAPQYPSTLPSGNQNTINDPNSGGLEAKTRQLQTQPSVGPPHDPFSAFNVDKAEGDEPRGVGDKYPVFSPDISQYSLNRH
jgi:hypothetical protein